MVCVCVFVSVKGSHENEGGKGNCVCVCAGDLEEVFHVNFIPQSYLIIISGR